MNILSFVIMNIASLFKKNLQSICLHLQKNLTSYESLFESNELNELIHLGIKDVMGDNVV